MSIYETAIKKAKNGISVSADFKNRTLKISGSPVKLEGDFGIGEFSNLDEWLDKVEDLYDDYKYSRPTQSSMAKSRKCKFRALTPEELVEECGHGGLGNPLGRDEAKAALEVFILLSLVSGAFSPEELFAKDWFYQGADKSLIIRKDWF